jgi:hypothetical protein
LGLLADVRLIEPVETIHTMEIASEARFDEALSLAFVHEDACLTAAYLLGYAVEMRLKAAVGRIRGLAPADDLYEHIRLAIIRAPDRHDLATLLELALASRRVPVSASLETDFRRHVGIVAENWDVLFRYKAARIGLPELADLFNSVVWIRQSHESLWR